MLGQPVYMLTPDVVGVHLKGELREGVTATDLVLTVTEMLRKAKVVGKFVEFFGEGAASLSVPDRATIANMSPEYGATMGFFPVDDKTIEYLTTTGRTPAEIDAFETYFRAQGLYGMPAPGRRSTTSKALELDLAIDHSQRSPARSARRTASTCRSMRTSFEALFSAPVAENGFGQSPDKLAPPLSGASRHVSRAARE